MSVLLSVPSLYSKCYTNTSHHLNFLKGVGDHGNEHVEQDDDDDEGEDAVQNPSYKLCQHKLRHVHVVLVGHTKHGPEQEVERLIKPASLAENVVTITLHLNLRFLI